MRTTITLDDALLDLAQRLTGVSERSALVRAGLAALIARESARRLARLGSCSEFRKYSAFASPRNPSGKLVDRIEFVPRYSLTSPEGGQIFR